MNLRCRKCGYQNRPGARFCRACGQELETEEQSYPVTEMRVYEGALVKCHRCHSPRVVGVCHVCGRLVCAEHEAKPNLVQDYKKAFAPALPRNQIRAAHCDEHPHFLNSPFKMLVVPVAVLVTIGFGYGLLNGWTLLGVLLFGRELTSSELIAAVAKSLISLTLLGSGLVLAGLGIREYVKVYLPESQGEPLTAVPIMPEQYAVKVREKAHLKMQIAEQASPYAEIQSAEGRISVRALVPRDARRRVKAFYQKYTRKGWHLPPAFHFGFVSMENLSIVDMPVHERMPRSSNVIPLKSKRVDFEALESGIGWQELYENMYIIKQDALAFGEDGRSSREMPVWFKPVLEPQSAGRTLRLAFDFADRLAGSKRIRELTLSIPPDAFGGHRVKTPILATNGRFYADRWVVEWIDWHLDASRRRARFPEVTFSFPITEVGVPLKVGFEIEIEGDTLSRIDIQPEHIWLPNGKRALRSEAGVTLSRTILLTGEVQIDPDAYCYQYEFSHNSSFKRDASRLTSTAIEKALVALQGNDVHVKSVVQNPVVVEPRDPVLERHSWDILGRWYKELYPIDVHVVLSEHRPEEEADGNGVVDVEVTLRVRVNTKNLEFERYVEDQCGVLGDELQRVL